MMIDTGSSLLNLHPPGLVRWAGDTWNMVITATANDRHAIDEKIELSKLYKKELHELIPGIDDFTIAESWMSRIPA
jgi:hypothetical protein